MRPPLHFLSHLLHTGVLLITCLRNASVSCVVWPLSNTKWKWRVQCHEWCMNSMQFSAKNIEGTGQEPMFHRHRNSLSQRVWCQSLPSHIKFIRVLQLLILSGKWRSRSQCFTHLHSRHISSMAKTRTGLWRHCKFLWRIAAMPSAW